MPFREVWEELLKESRMENCLKKKENSKESETK